MDYSRHNLDIGREEQSRGGGPDHRRGIGVGVDLTGTVGDGWAAR